MDRSTARKSTVLFVEDEPALLELVVTALATHGFTALFANDGYDALRIISERHIDLLFTDIIMPGISGFELAAQAKVMRPALRVLYATGHPPPSEERAKAPQGKVISKPIRLDRLVSLVEEALAA